MTTQITIHHLNHRQRGDVTIKISVYFFAKMMSHQVIWVVRYIAYIMFNRP